MAPNSSSDFGRKLREARERKGISLRQIASATKISVSALEALERNDISRLPGGIFSRAFVRSYAVEVGLDPETTIHEFIAQFPSDSVTAGHPATDRVEDEEAVESDRRMATTVLRLFLISVPVAIAVVYFGTAGRRFLQTEVVHSEPPPPVAAPAPPTVETPAPPAAPTVDVATRPPEPAGSEPARSEPAVTPAERSPSAARPMPPTVPVISDRLSVVLSVTRPCWISATVDGQIRIQRLMQPGPPQVLDVTRELILTAGDAAAVTMMLNGVEAKPLGRDGEVVTRRLNPMNFKDYLATR